MSNNVSAEKATLASFQRKAREHGNRLDVIGGLEMELKGLIDLAKGIDEQKSKVEQTNRGITGLQGKMEGKKIESEGLDARLKVGLRTLHDSLDLTRCSCRSNSRGNCKMPPTSSRDSSRWAARCESGQRRRWRC